jgi:antitoxin component YwqK of YwqJK toxin-antitoxin module
MKNYLNIFILSILHTCLYSCEKTIDISKEPGTITLKDKLCFYKGEIFTGKVIKTDLNGNTLLKSEFKDGKLNGTFETYGQNLKLTEKYTLIDGVIEGLYLKYFEPSGDIEYRLNLKNGKLDGPFKSYNEIKDYHIDSSFTKKTVSSLSGIYKNGELLILNVLFPNGKLKYKYFYKIRNGQRVESVELYNESGKLIESFDSPHEVLKTHIVSIHNPSGGFYNIEKKPYFE